MVRSHAGYMPLPRTYRREASRAMHEDPRDEMEGAKDGAHVDQGYHLTS